MDFVKSVMPEAEFDNHGDYCNGNVDLADGRRLWLTAFVLGGNEHDPPIMQMSVGVGRKACWLALPANGTPDEAVAAALKFLEPTKLIKGPSWLR